MTKRTFTNLDRAKVLITMEYPFFASLLLQRELIEDESIPTLGVDARGQIYYNPRFVERLDEQQLVFGLCHEIGHVIGMHAARVGTRDRKRWNIASDAWINDMLKAAQIGKWIEGCVDMPGSKYRFVDDIYNEIPDNYGQSNGGEGGGAGGGLGEDILERGEPLSKDEIQSIEARIRVEVAQAAQVAKMADKMPNELAKFVADIIDPGTPWYEILERHMTSLTRGEYSWRRPNKRMLQYAYLPSVGTVAKMGDIAIQVDVSGSISKVELDHYNGHMKRIIEQCSPERVHVLYTDTRVVKHEVFEAGEEVELHFYSGGGTDMEAGFHYLEHESIEPEVFVCLTDGYTTFREGAEPDYPVVWCISSNVQAPYGENVHFKLEQERA